MPIVPVETAGIQRPWKAIPDYLPVPWIPAYRQAGRYDVLSVPNAGLMGGKAHPAWFLTIREKIGNINNLI